MKYNLSKSHYIFVSLGLFLLLMALLIVSAHYKFEVYLYIAIFFTFISVLIYLGVQGYKNIIMPFLEPYTHKHPNIFTFICAILPTSTASIYCAFSLNLPDSNLYVELAVRAIGYVGLIFSVLLLRHWIKNYFQEKEPNISCFETLDEELKNTKSLGCFLKDSKLWDKFLADDRGKLYFDDNGKILPNNRLPAKTSQAIVAASLMYTLDTNNLFQKEYIIDNQIAISKRFLDIASSIKENKCRDPNLFKWIVELE